jgi:hypothetical protein
MVIIVAIVRIPRVLLFTTVVLGLGLLVIAIVWAIVVAII